MHDVIVIGSGPGGATTALSLAKSGVDVLLLDKATFPRDKICGDGLTPASISMLNGMGLEEDLHRSGYLIPNMAIRSRGGHLLSSSIPSVNGQPDYDITIPRKILDHLLLQRAMACGAKFQGNTNVRGIEHGAGGVEILASRGGRTVSFKARVAVIAVGANLRLLRHLGILEKTPRLISAARGYFEDVSGLEARIEAHFDGVPIPGYGWIFPTSPSTANVGLGYGLSRRSGRRSIRSARSAVEDFIRAPSIADMFAGASRSGPIRAWPIRIDFLTAPTYGNGCLLVGESAGLVSPLTGGGIEYALESGQLAAAHLVTMFESGDFSERQLAAYDKILRDRFQRLFRLHQRFRVAFLNPLLVDRFVAVAARREDLKTLLVKTMLGDTGGRTRVSPATILRVLLG